MAKLRMENFDGQRPRQSDTTLPDSWASVATNVRLYAGELRAYRGSLFDFDPVTEEVLSAFKFINPLTAVSVWLTWGVRTSVQRGSLADNQDFRLYWTGQGAPKKSNWALASSMARSGEFPGEWLEMAVPAPTGALTATATAGSSPAADSRYYVYTFISTFGNLSEESAPSPVSNLVDITASQSVDLTGFSSSPVGDYNITAMRIYRTLPGEKTIGAYVFVKEVAIGTMTTNDDVLDTATGEALDTLDWDAPPSNMQGLTSMANGMMAGFVGNSVYFCEPYYHHAWPAKYIQSVPDQIVGLGSYGNTLVVMTTGTPWLMVGVDPAQMSVERLSIPEPCISAESIAGDDLGVVYASPNGLVSIGPNARGIITHNLFRRKDWQEYAPNTMVGEVYDGNYFATFQSAVQGSRTMSISRNDKPALSFLTIQASAFFSDVQNGALFYVDNLANTIYELDADALNPYTYEWISKRFFIGQSVSWSCVQIDVDIKQIADSDDYAALLASVQASNNVLVASGAPLGGVINGSMINQYMIGGSILENIPPPSALLSCTFFLLGEKEEQLAVLSIDDIKPYRIPPVRSRVYQIKMTGTTNVRSVTLATSVQELRS